jgi:hypothetical protein
MLTRPHTGSPCDGIAFALACQALAAEAQRTRVPGRLLGALGEVLAEVDADGSFTPHSSVSGAPEPPAYGWYRTAEDVVCYVHEGRPFSLRCGERLVVAALVVLPEDARAVPDDDVDGFQQAGAELIEAFCARGRE